MDVSPWSATKDFEFSAVYREKAGFTLLELLLILTIIGLVALLAMPRFTQRPPVSTPELVSFLFQERAFAVQSGQENAVLLQDNALQARGGEARMPFGVDTRVVVHAPGKSPYLPYHLLTTFYPDGTMTAAHMSVQISGASYDVRLSPFSGITYQRAGFPD